MTSKQRSTVNSVANFLSDLYFSSRFMPFLPARRYASVGNRHRNVSVRPSVRPSVCHGSPKTLVFRRQILSPNSKGFPPNKSRSEKFSDFLALSVCISKMVADTAKVTISD